MYLHNMKMKRETYHIVKESKISYKMIYFVDRH